MVKKILLVSSFAIFGVLFLNIKAQTDNSNPVEIFKSQKCNSCHSIEMLDIEQKNKGSKAPDLSDVGTKHEVPFFIQYLKKEIEIDGKKHSVTYKGTESELGALVGFLTTLRGKQKPTE